LNQPVAQIAAKPTSSPEKVLEARGLRKRFGGTEVLGGVDLGLRRGEVVLLRGPNGAGKTTLINILTGHLEADVGEITIRTNGTVERFSFPFGFLKRLNPFLHFLPERVAREGVMRTWQDTRLFSSLGLAENIAVAAPAHPGQNPLNLFFRPGTVRRFEQTVANEARHRLSLLQLDGRDSSSGNRISLGQTKRVAIAQAISARARILFFDEPLAGLDADGIKSVVDMLRELSRDHGISIVVVEHPMNAPHILQIADTVWNLDQGVLTSFAAKDAASDSETAGTGILATLLESTGWEIAREHILPRGAYLRVYRQEALAEESQPVLEVRRLAIKRGNRWVIGRRDNSGSILDTLQFELLPGDCAFLLAPNGWGKTTILDGIAGLVPACQGTVKISGRTVSGLRPWQVARKGLRYVRSNPQGFPNISSSEYSQLAHLDRERLPIPLYGKQMGELSGGERQLVVHTRGNNAEANLILLDEPFAGLDGQRLTRVANDYLAQILRAKAVLIALPDRSQARGYSHGNQMISKKDF
jgi:branched-chain amino acid transport system ATP-binding protein